MRSMSAVTAAPDSSVTSVPATLADTRAFSVSPLKAAFHDSDTDTDIFADIPARIGARMSACRSACHRNNFNRACRTCRVVGEDRREEVVVGVVE